MLFGFYKRKVELRFPTVVVVHVWSHRESEWVVGLQDKVEKSKFVLKWQRRVEREGLLIVGKCHVRGAWDMGFVFKATPILNEKQRG